MDEQGEKYGKTGTRPLTLTPSVVRDGAGEFF